MNDGVSPGAAHSSGEASDQGNDSTMSQQPEPTPEPDSGIALASGSAALGGTDTGDSAGADYTHAEDGAAMGGDRED